MEIFFITGNEFKVELARKKMKLKDGITISRKKIYCPEMQLDKIEDVAKESARFAANELNQPCMKNDSGLIISALKGFPGPYTKFIEETITEEGVLKLLEGKENRSAEFVEVLAFCEPKKEPVVFKSVTKMKVHVKKSGNFGWSFDKILIPEGQEKTLAEFNDDERAKFWNSDGYTELSNYLNKLYS